MEDGNFLPNITFGMKTVKEMAAYSKAELDVHLLTTNPIKYIHELSESGMSADIWRHFHTHWNSYMKYVRQE